MVSAKFKIGGRSGGLPAVANPVDAGLDCPLFVMAGPCVIESRDICLAIADKLVEVSKKINVGMIFKASFDKANRSSISSFRGVGIDEGLKILSEVRRETNLPVMTDVHEASQAKAAGEVVDCLQVPAFLCRQTDLLCACGRTGRVVNIKKGQFLSPTEMQNVIKKVESCENKQILLTERGTFFGYNRLVNDMTAIEAMKQFGYPVVFDATHSTQQPGGHGDSSAGRREMAPLLARAAVAAGANGLFVEAHTEPEKAKSDASCIMPIEWLEDLLQQCRAIFEIVHK
jgi:2-dehydro-3-deoxyphosphooctonate aldolase (KDO 8-P synthase)